MYAQRPDNRTHTLARTLDGIGVRLIAGALLFLWFGWWTRQFWVSLALALGLVALLSWGYYIHRRRHRLSGHDREAFVYSIRTMSEEKLGKLIEDVFTNLPEFTHPTRTDGGILAKVGHQTVLIGWDQPEKGSYTSLGQWVAFLKNIKEQKADRGILISGGSFDRECRLAAQTCLRPRVELVDHQAFAKLASASGQSVPEPPLVDQSKNPGWLTRMFYVLVRPGRCIFYAIILLLMARLFRVYAWYYFGAAGLLIAAAGIGIWMRYRNRRRWDPLLPSEEHRFESSTYHAQRGS
jgi:hypothetical protein